MDLVTRVGPLPRLAAAAVHTLAATAARYDGVEPLSEQSWLNLDRPGVIHLMVDDGYAQVSQPDPPGEASAELVVAPAARGAGIGTALLEAALAAAHGLPAERLLLWAHGDLPAARALARSQGLLVHRQLWQMATLLPDAIAPSEVTTRAFVPGQDEAALLELNARAFAAHPEQGRLTLADLRTRLAQPWFRAADLRLAEQDDRLVGFAWLKVTEEETGELYVLGVAPEAQGRGFGRALTNHALQHLAGRGVRHAVLFVEATNTAAIRTYTRAGFDHIRTDVQYRADLVGAT